MGAIRGTVRREGYTAVVVEDQVYLVSKGDLNNVAVKMDMHPDSAKGFVYAARIAADMVRTGAGGFAIKKAAVLSRCILQSGGNYLEIGSQFGFSAVVAAEFCEGRVFCIDPMEKVLAADQELYGYLAEGHRSHAGERAIFDRNIKHFGFEDKVTLIEKFSDPWPVDEDLEFGTAYIDGDHSYEMVKKDFFNVMDHVTHYIILDDYLNEVGVDQAVPEIICEQDEFKLALATNKTVIMARPEAMEVGY